MIVIVDFLLKISIFVVFSWKIHCHYVFKWKIGYCCTVQWNMESVFIPSIHDFTIKDPIFSSLKIPTIMYTHNIFVFQLTSFLFEKFHQNWKTKCFGYSFVIFVEGVWSIRFWLLETKSWILRSWRKFSLYSLSWMESLSMDWNQWLYYVLHRKRNCTWWRWRVRIYCCLVLFVLLSNDVFDHTISIHIDICWCRGTFGLWIDSEFLYGSSDYCETFMNNCLASEKDFKCTVVECWGFHEPSKERRDQSPPKRTSILDIVWFVHCNKLRISSLNKLL